MTKPGKVGGATAPEVTFRPGLVDRRTKECTSNKEIRGFLTRYIVRELYPRILADLADSRTYQLP
ncbi:hypothetical protein GPA26_08975 [Aromatoleum petrolei]|uniref:Uncharacterized protein n=1 Tax=Aromatoleum petrolei TaxID=76116 RepID=A0ABX1MQK9_9RHOO|nr:hypothetical protein [Aromatoleum petrolei]